MARQSKRTGKPKILFISAARGVGGGEIYLANLIPRLADDYDCTVLGRPGLLKLIGAAARTRKIILFPRVIEKYVKRHYRLKRLYYGRYFRCFLSKNSFDLVNFQELDGAFIESVNQRPAIATIQTRLFIPENLRPWFAGLFGRLDHAACVSRQTMKDILELGVSDQKLTLIHNGVDIQKFKPSGRSGEYITWAGRLEEDDKNPMLFARIARAAAQQGLDYKFRLVGEGTALNKIRGYARRHKLDNLEVTGPKPAGEMPDIYHQSRLLCLTSKTEGLPLTVLEAMACGVPVVASDVGGLGEIINNRRMGRLVRDFAPESFLKEIRELMDDSRQYGEVSRQARQRIEDSFSIENTVRQMRKLYEEVLKSHA